MCIRDSSKTQALTHQLAYSAQHDSLTDLPNRLLLQDRLSQALLSAKRHGTVLAVLCLLYTSVADLIEEWRPDAVLFDNAGRTAQLLAARRCGARVVYISARRRQRYKAFRLRWMRAVSYTHLRAATPKRCCICSPTAAVRRSGTWRGCLPSVYGMPRRGGSCWFATGSA